MDRPRPRGGLGASGLRQARARLRQPQTEPPGEVDLVDELLAPGSTPPLLTVDEGRDVLAVLEAAAAAAPHTPAGARIAELADLLRVRLYAATHDSET